MKSLRPWINPSASLDFSCFICKLGIVRIYLSVNRRLHGMVSGELIHDCLICWTLSWGRKVWVWSVGEREKYVIVVIFSIISHGKILHTHTPQVLKHVCRVWQMRQTLCDYYASINGMPLTPRSLWMSRRSPASFLTYALMKNPLLLSVALPPVFLD